MKRFILTIIIVCALSINQSAYCDVAKSDSQDAVGRIVSTVYMVKRGDPKFEENILVNLEILSGVQIVGWNSFQNLLSLLNFDFKNNQKALTAGYPEFSERVQKSIALSAENLLLNARPLTAEGLLDWARRLSGQANDFRHKIVSPHERASFIRSLRVFNFVVSRVQNRDHRSNAILLAELETAMRFLIPTTFPKYQFQNERDLVVSILRQVKENLRYHFLCGRFYQ